VIADGVPTVAIVDDERPIDPQLYAHKGDDLISDLERLLRRKAIKEADKAKLIAKPKPVVSSPAPGDFLQIILCERSCFNKLFSRIRELHG